MSLDTLQATISPSHLAEAIPIYFGSAGTPGEIYDAYGVIEVEAERINKDVCAHYGFDPKREVDIEPSRKVEASVLSGMKAAYKVLYEGGLA